MKLSANTHVYTYIQYEFNLCIYIYICIWNRSASTGARHFGLIPKIAYSESNQVLSSHYSNYFTRENFLLSWSLPMMKKKLPPQILMNSSDSWESTGPMAVKTRPKFRNNRFCSSLELRPFFLGGGTILPPPPQKKKEIPYIPKRKNLRNMFRGSAKKSWKVKQQATLALTAGLFLQIIFSWAQIIALVGQMTVKWPSVSGYAFENGKQWVMGTRFGGINRWMLNVWSFWGIYYSGMFGLFGRFSSQTIVVGLPSPPRNSRPYDQGLRTSGFP